MAKVVVVKRKRRAPRPEPVERMLARTDAHEVNSRQRGGVPQARNHGSYTGSGSGSL